MHTALKRPGVVFEKGRELGTSGHFYLRSVHQGRSTDSASNRRFFEFHGSAAALKMTNHPLFRLASDPPPADSDPVGGVHAFSKSAIAIRAGSKPSCPVEAYR